MKKAVIYARVSSKEQEREGFSIPAQLKLLHEYASCNAFSLVKEFIDIETAKASGRQNFEEMVRFLKNNRECRNLLVEKTDRLYRNLRDAVTLEDLEIEIHLVKEGQIISKDAKSQTKLIHGMHLVLARHYIENLREEVKKGMREKAEQGMYPGRAPFGYRNQVHGATAPPTTAIFPETASRGLQMGTACSSRELEQPVKFCMRTSKVTRTSCSKVQTRISLLSCLLQMGDPWPFQAGLFTAAMLGCSKT